MKKIKEDGKAVQQDDRGNPLLTYNWIDTKAGGGRGADIGLPRYSWRKNSLLINFPFDLLKKAGIEPESRVTFKFTDDDPKAAKIEPGGRLKVCKRTDHCAFINVTLPTGGRTSTGSHNVMAVLESITVIDGNGIAFMLPGDLAFASVKEVER